jgi:hypothetical protein
MSVAHWRGLTLLSFRVECIHRTERAAHEDRIAIIGGVKADGTPWRLGESKAIVGIEAGSWALHVEGADGRRVTIVVATSAGKKYLKAQSDALVPDRLLALPECSKDVPGVRNWAEGQMHSGRGSLR